VYLLVALMFLQIMLPQFLLKKVAMQGVAYCQVAPICHLMFIQKVVCYKKLLETKNCNTKLTS
jgi:hypothetical protein